MRVGETIEINGLFWTPGRQDQARRGKVMIEKDGSVTLETTGFIGGKRVNLFNHGFERIEGSDDSGDLMILKECSCAPETINLGTLESMPFRYRARLATCGLRELGTAAPNYTCVSFSLDSLYAWLNTSPFSGESTHLDLILRYTTPPPVKFHLGNGYWLETKCVGLLSSREDERAVKHDVSLNIRSETPRPFEDFSTTIFRIHQLFCILMGKTVSLTRVEAVPYINDSPHDLESFTVHKFFYASNPYTEHAPKISPSSVVLNCNHILENYDAIFARWLEICDHCSSAMGLYILAGTDGYRYASAKFLAMAQALETLHRETDKQTRITKKEFQQLKETLKAACPDKHKKLFSDAFAFAYQLTLAQRLTVLTEPFYKSIGGQSVAEHMCKKIKESRNYYTHLDSRSKDKAAKNQELVNLYFKMRVLFELNLLRLLGVPVEELIPTSISLKDKVAIFGTD